jgi:hypothetical protein
MSANPINDLGTARLRTISQSAGDRTDYAIIGQTEHDVQNEITRLINDADLRLGSAFFDGPFRSDGLFVAHGYTRIAQTEEVA